MKSNSQSAEIFRISSAFGLWKSSRSYANLLVLLICIFFSANTWAQIPVPVITQNNSPACGETVNLTASCQGGTPSGYKYHWFSDAACTNEISSGVTGSNYENLAINIYDGLTIYCRLRKTTTETVINNFPYSGNEQVYDVPVGYDSFKFEVWGAQGGGRQDCGNGGNGGKGGYSKGILYASSGISSIYVYVGGMGYCGPSSRGIAQGGWNGGGSSWRGANAAAGGGGGTDIRINGNTFYHRIIVAGGGGGGGEDPGDTAGYGGGENGGNESGGHNNPGVGGSQTAAGLGGAFGLGANTRCDGGGGGGGWYGGGTNKGTQTIPTSDDDSDAGGAAGGSGYVYTSSTAGNYPSGCRLNSSLYLTNAETIAGNTSFPAVNSGNETGHSGNGHARITTTYYPTGAAGSIVLHSYVDDPTSATDAADCGSATVSAVAPDGCVIDWYDAPTGGNLLAQGSDTYTATASGTYYAESRKSAGCVSEHRVGAEATVWNFNGGTVGIVDRFDQEVQSTAVSIPITTAPATGRPTIEYQWYMNGVAISGATTENYTIPSATVAGLAVGDYLFTRKAKNNCNSGAYELASGSFRLVIVNPSGGTGETCGNGLILYCTPTGTSSATGSTTSPMDIVTALSTAASMASDDTIIIRMAAGEYTVNGTTLNLVDNLIIDGGWDVTSTGVWTKGTGETKLNGTFGTVTSGSEDDKKAIHRIAISSAGKQNWKLQDLSVNVTGYNYNGGSDYHSTSYKGNSVYGLYMANTSTGDSLIRVKINVGNGGKGGKPANYASAAANGNNANGKSGGSYKTVSPSDRSGRFGGDGGSAGTNAQSGSGDGGIGGTGNGNSGTNGSGQTYGSGGSGGQAVWDTGKNPGGNGIEGKPGATGSVSASVAAAVALSYGEYFIPGQGKQGKHGAGGAGGGGGGGSCGCSSWGSPKTGGYGGGGGGGGVGGLGGTGGGGGGGSFGIYCYHSAHPTMQQVKITNGTAGYGGAGQNGQNGGAGGTGASGIINTSGCNDNNHKGGKGGNGGNGGNGANGDTGPTGEAYKIVVVPTSGSATKTNDGYGDDLPSVVLTSIDYGISSKKGCTNSQIALTRSGGSWSGQYGTLVNDVTESSSSYSADNESIIVGYSALGSFAPTSDGRKVFITQERSIGEIDGTDEFDAGESGNYLYDESLSSGDIMYWSLVSEDGATQYSTAVSVYDGTDGNTFSVNSTVLGLTPGDYYIKLEVDNNCCGMSVPIWKSITVKEPSLLPIELTSFSAECDGKSSLVVWTTATERNNDHFVLERSDDAINFTEIARVAGVGNSIEPLDYTYTDYDIRNGDNYYRLWQVDYDGTRTASEIIVATCVDKTIDTPEVLTYPNPFSGELTVVLENFGNSKARIEVYDMLGCIVKAVDIDSSSQTNAILNLSNLPNAAYNIRVRTKDFVINKQVVKN